MQNEIKTAQHHAGVKKSDRWIPWYFVAFFVVLAILNGIFVTIANTTHRGVVTENAYTKGLHYNQTLAAAAQQQQLGWSAEIDFIQPALSLRLRDRHGRSIEEAKVVAYLTRTTQAGHDFQVPLPPIGDGIYAQDVRFPIKGQWHVRMAATWQQQHYQQSQRISVQ